MDLHLIGNIFGGTLVVLGLIGIFFNGLIQRLLEPRPQSNMFVNFLRMIAWGVFLLGGRFFSIIMLLGGALILTAIR